MTSSLSVPIKERCLISSKPKTSPLANSKISIAFELFIVLPKYISSFIVKLSFKLFLNDILRELSDSLVTIKSSFLIPSPNLIVSTPPLSSIISLPSPLLNTYVSFPAPPISISSPVSPIRISSPIPPFRVSFPVPPIRVSLPLPLSIRSLPSSPYIVSFQPWP